MNKERADGRRWRVALDADGEDVDDVYDYDDETTTATTTTTAE